MKKLLYLFVLSLICLACDSSSDQTASTKTLQISMDTVVVDAKEEFLYLNAVLSKSSVSPDKRYLYNFNDKLSYIEKIDLASLELISTHPFEKEGPNGIGSYVFRFKQIAEEQFLIQSFEESGLFSLDGTLLKKLETRADKISGHSFRADESMTAAMLNPEQTKLYTIFQSFLNKSFSFGIIDLETNTFEAIELPAYQKDFEAYHLSWVQDGKTMVVIPPQFKITTQADRAIISSNVTTDIYTIDLKTDSVTHYSYENPLSKNAKSTTTQNVANDEAGFRQLVSDYDSQITFEPPVWDETSQQFYRFSYAQYEEEIAGETVTKAEVFLTILDKDFQVVHSIALPNYEKAVPFHFVKDGQIWIFENVNDELGFIRLTIK
ncbi:DUF4221 family protein [Penaeicola halotolerans]|uniref:DUF4221 family protein n=1 Tax=Penaeicola halotolerans TaxID=2793196 RepID=UPI001CF80D8B|nr:DUF4221 family protein [Penaeicola halotolerans]